MKRGVNYRVSVHVLVSGDTRITIPAKVCQCAAGKRIPNFGRLRFRDIFCSFREIVLDIDRLLIAVTIAMGCNMVMAICVTIGSVIVVPELMSIVPIQNGFDL